MAAATLYTLCGLPGAGKTVLARQLAAERRAAHLDSDAWLMAIGADPHDASLRERFETMQWQHALSLLSIGTSVITEDAGWRRARREQRLSDAHGVGARVELVVFEVPFDVRWERVRRRNGEPAAVPISRAQLLGFEEHW
ncbi:MAG: AAA family ATPase, partial [Nocardioides sp.]